MFNNDKFLIAGGTGFLGSALVRRLLSEGAHVRATHWQREPNHQHDRLTWQRADLRDPAACAAAVAGVDYVFLAAANTAGAAVITETPLIHVTPNVVMNAHLLEAAYQAGVKKFLYFSSGAAYPDLGSEHRLAEDDMFRADPPDVYYPAGWMKRYTEILCHTYARKIRRPMPTVVIRPSNVYGPGDKFDFARSHVTAAQIRRVIERHRPIQVWGTGDDVRDVIYVDDFIEGVILAFAREADFLTVNIAAGKEYSVKDIVRTAIAVDNFEDAEVVFDTTKPQTIGKRTFDVSLARDLLGFEAKTSLAEGIRRTIEWYRQTYPS
ncbi:MAG: NAD-dependent epimerase/dehydratase family protein [Alphaproteobacteria bacterium]|nr:NAD-dependent epimerase/dehydratase family protein [Alphaproteobacteria bacterium]